MKLSKDELWARIKKLALEGKTVYTIPKGKPNTISQVDKKNMFIQGKRTPVGFNGKKTGIFAWYDTLMEDGYLIGESGKHIMMKPNFPSCRRRVVLAILREALKDETVVINGGIRLKVPPKLSGER